MREELGGWNSLVARELAVAVMEGGSVGRAVCVFSLSVSLLLLFPLFAVLLNCPYPDPPVSACFFAFSSAPRRGEERVRGAFVAGRSQTVRGEEDVLKTAAIFQLCGVDTKREMS